MGARRQPAKAPNDAGAELIKADARSTEDWRALLALQPDYVVLTLTPPEFSARGYQQGYVEPVRALLAAWDKQSRKAKVPYIMLVSSSGVYGQQDGRWVDEQTDPQPAGFTGMALLEAEQLLQESSLPTCVVRCSGIYGPGREAMVRRLLSGEITLRTGWTNRIHADDVAGIISHLVARKEKEWPLAPVYLATDSEPVRQADFVTWLAGQLNLDISHLSMSDDPGPRGSKRLDNRLICSTDYRFQYPSYQEGYQALLSELDKS